MKWKKQPAGPNLSLIFHYSGLQGLEVVLIAKVDALFFPPHPP